jgi:hypothetical protein
MAVTEMYSLVDVSKENVENIQQKVSFCLLYI